MRALCVTVMFTAAVVAACNSNRDATAPRRFAPPRFSVSVDTDTVAVLATSDSQPIKGWGVYPGGSNNPFYNRQGVIAESLLYAMGITYIRDQVDYRLYSSGGGSPGNVVLDTSQLNPYERKWQVAKQRHLPYILSVWSPPAIWKTGGLNGGQLIPDSEGSFVTFLTAVMEHLDTSIAGPPIAVSVANEPDILNTGYPTTPYPPALWDTTLANFRGATNFAKLQNILTFGPELSALDSAQDFLGGSNFTTLFGGFFADSAIGAYAVHTYGDGGWKPLRDFIESHHKDVWVTEYSKPKSQGNSDIAHAIDLMGALGSNLEILPTNYWTWWTGFSRATVDTQLVGSLILGDPNNLNDTVLTVTSMFYTLRKLWKTVIPGSWKLWTIASFQDKNQLLRYTTTGQEGSTAPRIDFYAFEENDTKKTVVVVSNWTNNDKRITLSGLPSNYTFQQGYVSDSASSDAEMIAQNSSTCWVPSGQHVARTVLYAPHRSVLVAVLN